MNASPPVPITALGRRNAKTRLNAGFILLLARPARYRSIKLTFCEPNQMVDYRYMITDSPFFSK
jgi:hypothetical protein